MDTDVNAILKWPSEPSEAPLMKAASLDMAKMLCEEFNADPDITDYLGRNAAFHAIRRGDSVEMLKYLIGQGTNLIATAMPGTNILDYAACRGSKVESLQFLLKHYPQLVNKQKQEWTALHWACTSASRDTVESLLCFGLKATTVITTHPPGSWTPLDILMHYSTNRELWDYGKRERPGYSNMKELGGPLGGPTTIQTIAFAAENGPDTDDQVAAVTLTRLEECYLCETSMIWLYDLSSGALPYMQ
ncbi:hypothetical protein D6D02_07844 [Aureobasidium pullulans]|nr:hypothetical protein D6D02_07844 [Aureobasidium pullulans]